MTQNCLFSVLKLNIKTDIISRSGCRYRSSWRFEREILDIIKGCGMYCTISFHNMSFPFFFVSIALVVDTLPLVNMIKFPSDLKIE